ncbi:hypothetical protein EYF80_034386 [Liparis tanakae]|uniref:Uncharacterized protein n=1 Tax=Liparis tanakae TaxID=230148 RepID=A0A4Z2GRS7_9TELE|nr:hypothetical protein EYF80_034386 [Liparis tanakae]
MEEARHDAQDPTGCGPLLVLRSLVSPLVLGLAVGATVDTALGGRFPGTLTVVLSRSISFPCTFCM